MARTTADLLYSVKTGNAVPSSPSLIDDTRILAFADEEVEGMILPAIYSMNQEYLLNTVVTPLTAGVDTYQVAERALGRTLREIKLWDGKRLRNISQIRMEEAQNYTSGATPGGFYFFGDNFVLVPPPNSSSLSVYQYIFQRPGHFCLTTDCSNVVSVASNVITVDQVPTTITSGTVIDFIQGISGNRVLASDVATASASGTTITFASASSVPTTLAAGDWISVAKRTPVVQFPEEAFSYLVMLTSIRVLTSIGDTDGANQLKEGAEAKKKMFEKMIAPRIQGENIKLSNRGGLLKGRGNSALRRGIIFS